MLALLLVVSLLPMAAMAEGTGETVNEQDNITLDQNYDKNTGDAVSVPKDITVGTNEGYVVINDGTVKTNENTVDINQGAINTNNKFVTENEGTVGTNNNGGFVSNNTGTVENNMTGGTVVNNMKGGIVTNNTGTVENNMTGGTVVNNYGGTEVNNKGGVVNNNGGTVVNNYGGPGVNNNADGVVNNNGGTVVSNSGVVCNNTDGSVVKVNEVDGIVSNNSLGPDADGPKVETNFGTVNYHKHLTYYGVHYEDESKNKVYINQFKENTEVSISELNISRPGYKLVNCQAVEVYDRSEENLFADVTNDDDTTKNDDGSVRSFTVWAPTRLKLLWEKIVTAVAPAASNEPEAKPVKAAVPSTVKAEDVKVGTVVRAKGQLFKVIEMDDGSMTVVTMGKLSKKDMEDLKAFLAKYFTPEQIELLLGAPELISGALAEELFGGNTNHIVFKAARNLFA